MLSNLFLKKSTIMTAKKVSKHMHTVPLRCNVTHTSSIHACVTKLTCVPTVIAVVWWTQSTHDNILVLACAVLLRYTSVLYSCRVILACTCSCGTKLMYVIIISTYTAIKPTYQCLLV